MLTHKGATSPHQLRGGGESAMSGPSERDPKPRRHLAQSTEGSGRQNLHRGLGRQLRMGGRSLPEYDGKPDSTRARGTTG